MQRVIENPIKATMCGENMDEKTKELFMRFFKLDVNKCVEIRGEYDSLEILIGSRPVALRELVENSTCMAKAAGYSTKKITEYLSKSCSYPFNELILAKYIEFSEGYGAIRHEREYVGYVHIKGVYNGFPNLIKSEEINSNLKETHREMLHRLEKTISKASFEEFQFLIGSAPEKQLTVHIGALPSFLDKNKIYDRATRERIRGQRKG